MITGVRSLGSAAFHRQTCKCLFPQNEYLILLRKIHHRCLGTNITLDSLIIKNNFNNLYKKQIMRHFSEGDHRGKKIAAHYTTHYM